MYIKHGLKNKQPSFSFKPDMVAHSVHQIDFTYLKSLGVTTCFLDLDGTVVSRGTFEISDDIARALKKSGLDIKIATNRPRSRSLQELENDLGATGVIHPAGLYGKPTKRYIRNALQEFGLQRHEVVMIGDRFIQDILGANRSGIYSLAVYKLGESKGYIDRIFSRIEKYFTNHIVTGYTKGKNAK